VYKRSRAAPWDRAATGSAEYCFTLTVSNIYRNIVRTCLDTTLKTLCANKRNWNCLQAADVSSVSAFQPDSMDVLFLKAVHQTQNIMHIKRNRYWPVGVGLQSINTC
jgi:hypothetical protein